MPHPIPDPAVTANERFKRGFASWFWAGLVLATLLHLAVFVASPTFAIAGITAGSPPLELQQLPEIEVPPEPEEIVRPAAPVLSTTTVDDVTIPETRLESAPLDLVSPPERGDGGLQPGDFTPMTIRPALRNAAEVARALVRHYPAPLRNAGIGGTVTVWFHIDTDGRVRGTRLDRSSGYDALDRAALQVADMMRFAPAYNRDQRVEVWVSIPITFETER